jgi:hypothetical protein
MQASKNQQVKGRVRVLSSVRGTPSVIIRSERKAEGWGSTRVLFWNGLLWYRSAIVFEDVIRQYLGCVGKVRAYNLSAVVLSL